MLPTSQGSGKTDGILDDEGWIKFPNGLIMQWGKWTAPNGPWTSPAPTVTFPIPFPHHCISVIRDNDNTQYGNVGINYSILHVSNTGFSFHTDWYYGHYIAIGY